MVQSRQLHNVVEPSMKQDPDSVRAGVELACKVMNAKANQTATDLQLLGCLSMRMALLREPNGSREEVGSLACDSILAAMRANPKAANLQQQGCAVLLLLATECTSNQQRIRDNSGAALTLQASDSDAKHAELQVAALELLHVLLAGCEKLQEECKSPTSVAILNAALEAHQKNLAVASPALDILALVLPFPGEIGEKSKHEEQEILAVQNAIAAMSKHPTDFDVQSMGALVLEKVSQARGQRVADAIIASGGVEVLEAALKAHGDHPSVAAPALATLGPIAAKGTRNLVEKRVIPALGVITGCMQRHSSVVHVQRGACEVIRGLVQTSTGPTKVYNAGGYDLVITAAINHRKDFDVQDRAFQALASLSHVMDFNDLDLLRRATDNVMKFLRASAAANNLHLEGMQVLASMVAAGRLAKGTPDFETYSLILEGFVSAMQALPNDSPLQLFGCKTLGAMDLRVCIGNQEAGAYAKRAAGAVDSVVAAMNRWGDNVELQIIALKALQNLTKTGAEACVRISACGGLKRVHELVRDQPAQKDIQVASFDLLTSLTAMAGKITDSPLPDAAAVEGSGDGSGSPSLGQTPSKVSRAKSALKVLNTHSSLSTALKMAKGTLAKPSPIVIYTKMGLLGGMECLVSFMKDQKVTKEQMSDGLKAIRALTTVQDTDNGYRFLRIPGALDVVIKIMRGAPNQAQVQDDGMAILAGLCHADGADDMMEREVTTLLMETMSAHKSVVALQISGCSAFQGLTSKKKHLTALREMGVLDIVLRALSTFGEEVEIVDNGCSAVENIIASAPRVATPEVIEVILKIMKGACAQAACVALVHLSGLGSSVRDSLVGCGALEAVAAYVKAHKDEPARESGRAALEALSPNMSQEQLTKYSSIMKRAQQGCYDITIPNGASRSQRRSILKPSDIQWGFDEQGAYVNQVPRGRGVTAGDGLASINGRNVVGMHKDDIMRVWEEEVETNNVREVKLQFRYDQ